MAMALFMPAVARADPIKDFTVTAKTVKADTSDKKANFVENLYDGLKGPKVGSNRLRCKRLGKNATCTGRATFDDGTVRIKGTIGTTRARVPGENEASTLPIVDGTGAYQDAKGTFIFNAIARKLSQERFDFVPEG